MIRHIVLFTLDDGVARDDPRVLAAVEESRALASQVEGGQSWIIEANISDRAIAADFAGVGDFPDAGALQRFLQHPTHVAAAQRWGAFASWQVGDIPVEPL